MKLRCIYMAVVTLARTGYMDAPIEGTLTSVILNF